MFDCHTMHKRRTFNLPQDSGKPKMAKRKMKDQRPNPPENTTDLDVTEKNSVVFGKFYHIVH